VNSRMMKMVMTELNFSARADAAIGSSANSFIG
jgi:hypothetical protein